MKKDNNKVVSVSNVSLWLLTWVCVVGLTVLIGSPLGLESVFLP